MDTNAMIREMRDDLFLYSTIFDVAGPHAKLENIYTVWKNLRARSFWTVGDVEYELFKLGE